MKELNYSHDNQAECRGSLAVPVFQALPSTSCSPSIPSSLRWWRRWVESKACSKVHNASLHDASVHLECCAAQSLSCFQIKLTFVCRHLSEVLTGISCVLKTLTSSGLQFEVVYWPAMTLGITAQVAAAHCPNQRTLDPQSAARQTHLCPSQPHSDLHPTMFSGNDSLF